MLLRCGACGICVYCIGVCPSGARVVIAWSCLAVRSLLCIPTPFTAPLHANAPPHTHTPAPPPTPSPVVSMMTWSMSFRRVYCEQEGGREGGERDE